MRAPMYILVFKRDLTNVRKQFETSNIYAGVLFVLWINGI